MVNIIGTGQMSLVDLNDAKLSSVAPTNPSVGELWIDSNISPLILKEWNGTTWISKGEIMNQGTSETITSISATLGNMTNDNVLDLKERQLIKDKINEIIGKVILDSETALPTSATLDSNEKGGYYSVRKSALNAGLLATDGVYIAVKTRYDELKVYLDAMTPIKPWNSTTVGNITVVKATFREKWLNYYLSVESLASATSLKLKQNVDNIKVGGRNLVLNSNKGWVSSAYSIMNNMNISQDWVEGNEYHVTLMGTINDGNRFAVYRDFGYRILGFLKYNEKTGLYEGSFICPPKNPDLNYSNGLSVFNNPTNTATSASIDWIKVEKGNIGTDFTLAPEDMEGRIDNVESKITPTAIVNTVTSSEKWLITTENINDLRNSTVDASKTKVIPFNDSLTTADGLVPNGSGNISYVEGKYNKGVRFSSAYINYLGNSEVKDFTIPGTSTKVTFGGTQDFESWRWVDSNNIESYKIQEEEFLGRYLQLNLKSPTTFSVGTYFNKVDLTSSKGYKFSFYIKANETIGNMTYNIYLDSTSGTRKNTLLTGTITSVNSDWKRVIVNLPHNNSNTFITSGTSDYGLLNVQLGGTFTSGSTFSLGGFMISEDLSVTNNYIIGSITNSFIDYRYTEFGIGQTEGTVFLWATPPTNNDVSRKYLFSLGTATNIVFSLFRGENNIFANVNSEIILGTTTSSWGVGYSSYAITWKNKNVKIFYNGVKVKDVNVTSTALNNITRLVIGNSIGASGVYANPALSDIDEFRIDKVARTDEDILSWHTRNAPFVLDQNREELEFVKTKLESVQQSISREGITTAIQNSVFYENYMQDLDGKANADIIGDLINREEYEEGINEVTGLIKGIDTSKFITEQKVIETVSQATRNFYTAGGINLIKNSLGFAEVGTNNAVIDNWFRDGDAITRIQNQELDNLGFGSGFQKISGSRAYLYQWINVIPGQEYTLSFFLKLSSDLISISITNPDSSHIYITDGRLISDTNPNPPTSQYIYYATVSKEFERFYLTFKPNSNKVRININTNIPTSYTMTGFMAHLGSQPLQWSLASGEVYNTNVRMDINGIRVSQLDSYGEEIGFTQITPNEFAGYYKNGNTTEKVFYLNGEETTTKKLRATDEITMGTVKIIKIPLTGSTSTYRGWAIVQDNG